MNVLAVGAHPDDVELGCGAALLAHRRAGHEVTLLVMTSGENGPQQERSRRAEQEDAAALLGATVIWGGFQDGAVPADGAAISVVEAALAATAANLVYIPASADTHQDHRATASAALSAARRARRLLSYETPTTVNFTPTFYIDAAGLVEGKLELLRAHLSQVLKNGLVDLEAVEAQARYRGFQSRMREAEAFETSRFVWDIAIPAVTPIDMSVTSQEATK